MLHPSLQAKKVKKSCTCSHSSPAGMERPRAIHIWRDDNRQILLEVEGDKNYRTRVDRKVLEAFTNLVRQHPLAAWNNFKDQPCHAWLEKRERESFSLVSDLRGLGSSKTMFCHHGIRPCIAFLDSPHCKSIQNILSFLSS